MDAIPLDVKRRMAVEFSVHSSFIKHVAYLPEKGNSKALSLTKQAMRLVIRKVLKYLMRYTQGKCPQDIHKPEEQHAFISSAYVHYYMNSHIVINSGERQKLLQSSKKFKRGICI